MRNSINKAFREGPWTVMSFPRQSTSIVYNAEDKKYSFHEGVAKHKSSKTPPPSNTKSKWARSRIWYVTAIILAGALGVSLAINLVQWIIK